VYGSIVASEVLGCALPGFLVIVPVLVKRFTSTGKHRRASSLGEARQGAWL
jgi:hypothetical protein